MPDNAKYGGSCSDNNSILMGITTLGHDIEQWYQFWATRINTLELLNQIY